jgi:hypothetical protein
MSKHEEEQIDSNYWSTKRIGDLLRKVEDEGLDYKSVDNPFHDGDPDLKKSNLLWEYTTEELQEMQRCAKDVVHFAKHCQVMTDNGLQYIQLRDYQESVLREYQNNRFNVFLAPRQVGKCLLPTSYIRKENGKKVIIKHLKNKKNQRVLSYLKNFLYKLYYFI